MSPVQKYAIGAGAAVLLSLIIFGWGTITLLVVLGVIAAPVVGYFMLDQSQRERLKRVRRRGIGR
jgi:Flp pilus assembly protein TadB